MAGEYHTNGKVKAVFFDVGDTLMTIPEAQFIIQRYLAERELHRPAERIGELFHTAFKQFYYEKKVGQFAECTPESDREFWMSVYRYIIDHLGVRECWSEQQIFQTCHELYDLFTGPEHYVLFEDVAEVLGQLAAQGYRLGVISNFAPTLHTILDSKGIVHFFDPFIVSTVIGLEKPDPAIFSAALELSGLSSDEVVYVGDHEINDVWAPAQAGIRAIRIKRYDYQTGSGIHSLRELIPLLAHNA